MDSPLVTVLIPARNPHRGYLQEAFESLLSQSTDRWEALLITDPDDSSVESLDLPDERFTQLRNEGAKLSGALNTGMKAARTGFATILLGDDRLEPTAVETLGRHIREHPSVDFFHSSVRIVDANNHPVGGVRRSWPARTQRDFLNHAVTHLMCWRVAKALSMGGIDESLGVHGADDYDFPWSMWEAGASFMPVEECLYVYRMHFSHYRLTTHVPRSIQVNELRKIFTKHGLPEELIATELETRQKGYLMQALFP